MYIGKRDMVCLAIPGQHGEMGRALHQCCSTIAKKSTFWFQVSLDNESLLRIGKKVGRDRWMVGNLLCQIIALAAVIEFVSTAKDLSKHGVVRLFHTL